MDPFKHAPENLESLIQEHVQRAKGLAIEESLVFRYARILIAADEVVKDRIRRIDRQSLRAAAEHGVFVTDPAKARLAYSAARRNQQQIHNSVTGCSKKLRKFDQVLSARYKSLPQDVISHFPLEEIRAASERLHTFASATALQPNLLNPGMARSPLSLTKSQHALIWWRSCIPHYRGKWHDMHTLARRWRLTNTKDLDHFKRLIRKPRPELDIAGRPWILGCPPWALI
jgi:hypothetical protein